MLVPYLFVGPHDEEVGHQRREARGEAALGHESQLHLGQTDDLVRYAPRREVHQEGLQLQKGTRFY